MTPSIGLSGAPGATGATGEGEAANEDFLFHLYRGSELLQDNRAHEAKEELERALNLQPNDTKGQDLLAVVYFRLGHFPRAIAIYEQLRRKSPRDTALLLNLALCYLKTGQPLLARRDLEQLLTVNPTHTRAWGYLGLACERLGDLSPAQRAFEQGGHAQMARRMVERRKSMPAPEAQVEAANDVPSPIREVVAAAFEELDAGELSFALAEPAADPPDDAAAGNWQPIELGQRRERSPETIKPDTRDGPPAAHAAQVAAAAAVSSAAGAAAAAAAARVAASLAQFGLPPASQGRRATLIAPAPPAANHADVVARYPSAKPPTFDNEAPAPSLRRPVVAVPPVRRGLTAPSPPSAAGAAAQGVRHKTLPPAFDRHDPVPIEREPVAPPSAAMLAQELLAPFPEVGNVTMHSSGIALVRTSKAATFAARLEAIRAQSAGLVVKLLERHARGKPTGESFGGAGSPIVHAAGDGQLVIGPRPGRKLSSFALEDELCFVREDVLLGFDGELAFENGRLATGEGDFVSVVQLRGKGAVLVEVLGDVLSLDVRANRGIHVRRETLLGWFGRLVPRALPSSEAPCGQRGLVSFGGEGRVLVATG